jgi:Flp pilus assembly protein TadD
MIAMTKLVDYTRSLKVLPAADRSGRLDILAACLIAMSGTLLSSALVAQNAAGAAPTNLAEGVQLLRNGQPVEAKTKLDAAVAAAPHSADALTWRGISENQLQQYAAAASDFKAALRLDGAMVAAHYNLALSLIRLHQTNAAIEQLRIVITAQPAAVQPLYNIAVLLESKGSFVEAITNLRTAHALAPNDKGVSLHLLTDSLKLKQTEELAPLLVQLKENSTAPEIEREAGTALLEAGRVADSVELLKIARSREPNAPGIDLLLARALIEDGRNSEAIALLSTAQPAAGEKEEIVYLQALAYLGEGSLSDASKDFEAAALLDPKDARPMYHLGLIAAQIDREPANAARLLHMAYTLDPGNQDYLLALARALLANDQAEEAKELLEKAATNDERPQVRALKGIAFVATHDIPQAMSQLSNALKQDPTLALAQNVLGFCYLQQGKYLQAASAYGKASDLEPTRALYARDAALAFERANQQEPAMHFAERASALDDKSAADHALLGKLYAASGHDEDALRELLRATELDPDLDSAVYLLARTYQRLGERQQAAAWSTKLSALKQEHEAAFTLQKKAAAEQVRSSTLLKGGSSSLLEAGDP